MERNRNGASVLWVAKRGEDGSDLGAPRKDGTPKSEPRGIPKGGMPLGLYGR